MVGRFARPNKPPRFLAVSRYGKVPALVDEEDDADEQAGRVEFARHCARLNDELDARTPWFLGERYTLVDVTYASRFARLERYAGLALPEPLIAWWRRISERPAYVATGGLKARSPVA